MEFKIDTKDIYTHITPLNGVLDANLAAALKKKLSELGQSVSYNLIIDLENCSKIDATAYGALIDLHTDWYSRGRSLVFTGVHEGIMEDLKKNNVDTALNITPTLIEAIDIVSMEILERDLQNEE